MCTLYSAAYFRIASSESALPQLSWREIVGIAKPVRMLTSCRVNLDLFRSSRKRFLGAELFFNMCHLLPIHYNILVNSLSIGLLPLSSKAHTFNVGFSTGFDLIIFAQVFLPFWAMVVTTWISIRRNTTKTRVVRLSNVACRRSIIHTLPHFINPKSKDPSLTASITSFLRSREAYIASSTVPSAIRWMNDTGLDCPGL